MEESTSRPLPEDGSSKDQARGDAHDDNSAKDVGYPIATDAKLEGAQDDDAVSSDSGHEGDSDAEEELKREEELRRKLAVSREKFGSTHAKTISRVHKLVSCLIGEYKLNETEALLDEIMPACRELGGVHYIKAIQSRAFCLFKQYRFKEALKVFHEQTTLVGPSGALYENMAHTYNSIGDYDNAEKYFSLAMDLVENKGKKGGILLGIGLVKERKGAPREALPFLKQALQLYQEASGSPDGSSLIAKAHMSVGQCHETLGEMPNAINHIRAAVRIFRKTVGDSPLTANALGTLGRMLLEQDLREEAEPTLCEALRLEVSKDAFHPDTVWKLLNNLKDLWTEGGQKHQLAELRDKCSQYVAPMRVARRRIQDRDAAKGTPYDRGTVAVIYKTGGELLMLAGSYEEAMTYLRDAVQLLDKISDFDCRSLIMSCESSLHFIKGQLTGSQRGGGSSRVDSDSE